MEHAAKDIIEKITAFSNVSQVPATLIDSNGTIQWEYLPERKFCSIFSHYNQCHKDCIQNLKTSARTAVNLKEPYLFMCKAGLIKIAFPVKSAGSETSGCFFIGPICMGTSKDNLINRLMKKTTIATEQMTSLLKFAEQIQIKSSHDTSYLYDVFCNCVLSYNILENNFGIIPSEHTISSFQSNEKMPYTTNHYPETLPQNLVYHIKTGDKESALDALRLIYEKIYLLEAGNFNATKVRLTEMLHYLSRSISADLLTVPFYIADMEALHNAYAFSDFYRTAQLFIIHLAENLSTSMYYGDSPVIKNAVTYINTYFNLNITLASTAENLRVNPSYLSTLFKAEMQKTFSEYLLEVRLNNSIQLLLSTHLSITDIAINTGFSNQSYYIKMFKKNYGMTPGQYRKKMK